ncbi:hypothetical protein PsYK624_114890 [Phanerochaete sordida]|uniref:Uncharacterized protein n=1 Tax=Phanerochaete sordida TaxID=48140 RepID=A0A9P3LHG5_9APHY|nr:hypothetical protein PsYK624_114890 [Phanerochaete sordida]
MLGRAQRGACRPRTSSARQPSRCDLARTRSGGGAPLDGCVHTVTYAASAVRVCARARALRPARGARGGGRCEGPAGCPDAIDVGMLLALRSREDRARARAPPALGPGLF